MRWGHGSDPCPFSRKCSDTASSRRPLVYLSLGFIASDPIPLLDSADELLSFPLYAIQVIIGELAPLFANTPLQLIPLTSQRVFVHVALHFAPP